VTTSCPTISRHYDRPGEVTLVEVYLCGREMRWGRDPGTVIPCPEGRIR